MNEILAFYNTTYNIIIYIIYTIEFIILEIDNNF